MLAKLSAKAQESAQNELGENEKMLWCDEPDIKPVRALSFIKTLFKLFLNFIGIIPLVIGAGGLLSGDQTIGGYIGYSIPALIGLALLVVPWLASGKEPPWLYILTDQRAIIFADDIYSCYPDQLQDATLKLNPDGSGHIIFEEAKYDGSHGGHDFGGDG